MEKAISGGLIGVILFFGILLLDKFAPKVMSG